MNAKDTNLLRISDRARSRILGILEEHRRSQTSPRSRRGSEGEWVRLFAEAGPLERHIELAIAIDEKRPGDRPIADDALPLVADGESLRALEGLILDYEESMAFRGFTLCRERSCAPPDFGE